MGSEIAQAIAAGILGGGVYALMAAGLTLVFGVLDIINVAQGILVVLGAYLSYVLSVHLHLDLLVGLVVTVPAMFVLGVGIYWLFIRPLRGAERTSMTLLACFAVALIIEGVLYREFGSNYVSLKAWYITASVHLFGFYLADIYLIGFGLAVVTMAVLYLMLYRTTFGRSVRATMQNPAAARLIGIDVTRVSALTFGIGTAVTAIGGMVYGAISGGFTPNSGYDLISRLLAIVILAGLGSVGGALAAAVFMTTAEAVVDIWQPQWAVAVFYLAMVIILVVRPAGLAGRRAVRAQ
ncbi:MAG TPA: branched-chain amino acid ABC transporter permease [Streptosporangiaceae bacterium]|jgi:branched-chain amino acid transport system permease protein